LTAEDYLWNAAISYSFDSNFWKMVPATASMNPAMLITMPLMTASEGEAVS